MFLKMMLLICFCSCLCAQRILLSGYSHSIIEYKNGNIEIVEKNKKIIYDSRMFEPWPFFYSVDNPSLKIRLDDAYSSGLSKRDVSKHIKYVNKGVWPFRVVEVVWKQGVYRVYGRHLLGLGRAFEVGGHLYLAAEFSRSFGGYSSGVMVLDPTLKKASYRDIRAKGPCDLDLVDL